MLACVIADHSDLMKNVEDNCPREFLNHLVRMTLVCFLSLLFFGSLLSSYVVSVL